VNNNSTGTISLQVFYTGARPAFLTPSFVAPGTVYVEGVRQTSGSGSHDFSAPLEYRVVSRNGQNERKYSVTVEFVSLTHNAPRITSFTFSQNINRDLIQDTAGAIGDDRIMIDARYGGGAAPGTLIPEFSAEGIVTVYSAVQVSGASGQDFSREIKYVVTNPANSQLKREYRVQTRFTGDTSSSAIITGFGFYRGENDWLRDDVIAHIDEAAGKISLYAPIGSGITTRLMTPRFEAKGQVSVGGVPQSSGGSVMEFSAPVTYTVVSANGRYQKNYVVEARELSTTIYVNQNAGGRNDGTSWNDAFINLQSACQAVEFAPADTPLEIWIAKGTYTPGVNQTDYFRLRGNTSYLGGFAGYETAKNMRDPERNKTILSGGGRTRLFGRFDGSYTETVNGDVVFDGLGFTTARTVGATGDYGNGAAINVRIAGGKLSVTNCDFTDMSASNSGGAMYINASGETVLEDVKIANTTAGSYCEAIYLTGNGNKTLTRLEVRDIEAGSSSTSASLFIGTTTGTVTMRDCVFERIEAGAAIRFSQANGDIDIDEVTLRDITGDGISAWNYPGTEYNPRGNTRLANIHASKVGKHAVNFTSIFANSISLEDSDFNFSSGIWLNGSKHMDLKRIESINSGIITLAIQNYVMQGATATVYKLVHDGGGLNIGASSGGGPPVAVQITESVIRNCSGLLYGGGIAVTTHGEIRIENTAIIACTADNINYPENSQGGAIYISPAEISDITISGCTIRDCKSKGIAGGIYFCSPHSTSASILTVENTTFTNIKAGSPVNLSSFPLNLSHLFGPEEIRSGPRIWNIFNRGNTLDGAAF
jgi:hypothetical protein